MPTYEVLATKTYNFRLEANSLEEAEELADEKIEYDKSIEGKTDIHDVIEVRSS